MLTISLQLLTRGGYGAMVSCACMLHDRGESLATYLSLAIVDEIMFPLQMQTLNIFHHRIFAGADVGYVWSSQLLIPF